MAYTDFGQLMPSEAGFKTPGMYGAFLQAEGAKKASYLSDMDQFFANLTETTRRFNEELGFKFKELASRESLSREEFNLRKELQDEELEYRRWMIGQTTASSEKIARIGAEAKTGGNYLGGPTSKEIFDAMQKNRQPARGGTTEPEGSNIRVWQQGKNNYLSPEDEALARSRASDYMGSHFTQVPETYRSDYGQGGSKVSGVSDTNRLRDNWENFG